MNFADGDGSLDVIIYIILMVVGLAASAYRNYTKRKQAEQKKVQGEVYTEFPELDTEPAYNEDYYDEEPDLIDSSFNQTSSDSPEITGTNQPVVPEPLAQIIEKESLIDRPVSEVESLKTPELLSGTSIETIADIFYEKNNMPEDDISIGDLSQDEIQDTVADEEFSEEFDVKKAVIYSEIINRKYI